MIPYVRKSYADIFEEFYNVTKGDIILGGSLGLRLQNVIDREINDIDLDIKKSDWDLYEKELVKNYKFYNGPVLHIEPKLRYKIVTCLTKNNTNEFHLFINYIEEDLYNIVDINGVKIKVLKPELHLLDKECMIEDDVVDPKHLQDIECIKKYLNEK